jgi:hypothetical protein
MRSYYVAVNDYRTSTSSGFANTWRVYRVTRSEQMRALRDGLPVRDQELIHDDGTCSASYSCMGIRLATRWERALASRDADA